MPPEPPKGFKAQFLRFWRSEDKKIALLRDVAVAVAAILVVTTVAWVYTGQPFPDVAPVVVIESESMMHGPYGPCLESLACTHAFDSPGFGRLGTIDPGDLVFVKDVDSLDEIETAFAGGKRSGYGGHGDVIVYKKDDRGSTPVIHRAMLRVDAGPEGCKVNDAVNPCLIRIPETCNPGFGAFVKKDDRTSDWASYCQGSTRPVNLTLERDGLFMRLHSYPCATGPCPNFRPGILTKGDRNSDLDVAGGSITCCPVPVENIVGKARGELPWVGLIKLALKGNSNYHPAADPTRAAQWSFLKATAPWDTWVCLVLLIGFFVAAPPAYDWARAMYAKRKQQKP